MEPVQNFVCIEKDEKVEVKEEFRPAIFIVRSVEPNKSGGKKPVSKEYFVKSDTLIQNDPVQQ